MATKVDGSFIGTIIHVRAVVNGTTVRCVPAIVTSEPQEYRVGSLPAFVGFDYTLFAPHGATLDAARRGAPIPFDSNDYHERDACDRFATYSER